MQQKQLEKEKADALDGNLHIPIMSALHESLGAARTESTYVADRLAGFVICYFSYLHHAYADFLKLASSLGEPKHGPVTNIPAPVAPAPIFGSKDANNVPGNSSVRSTGNKFTSNPSAGSGANAPPSVDAADGAFDALAALEGTAGSRYTKQARYQPHNSGGGNAAASAGQNQTGAGKPSIFGGNSNLGHAGNSNYGIGGNSVSSQSNYGYGGGGSSNAYGGAGPSTLHGGSHLAPTTDISGNSKNAPSRFSRLAQFGMGGGTSAVDQGPSAMPVGGRHGAVQPLSSGYGTNNTSSITGAGAQGRHKF